MSDVIVEDAPDRVERRSVVVDASPAEVFDVLADPSRHSEIDGSGTVRGSRASAPERLSPGAKFGMSMKMGVPYAMSNTVVEFVENERIAWRHIGRHVWRYTLEATDDGRTKVTEEFDWRPAIFPPGLKLIKAPTQNAVAIEKTLTRIAELFAS